MRMCPQTGQMDRYKEDFSCTDTAKWPTTLRFEKILGTTSVVRSIENPQDVLQNIHRQ